MWVPTTFRIIGRAVSKFNENRGAQMGAALAYYALFSVAPILLIAIFIAGSVLGEEKARETAKVQLEKNFNKEVTGYIMTLIEHSKEPRGGSWAPYVAVVVMIVGALNVFFQMRTSFCVIWELSPPKGNSFFGVLLSYLLAIVMVLVVGVLLIASVIIGTVITFLQNFMERRLPELPMDWNVLLFLSSLVFLTIVFGVTYRILSGRTISWFYIFFGASTTALLFTIGKTVLSYYFALSRVVSTYGAGGHLVVFLIWVYYSSIIMIFGAELIQAMRTQKEWIKKAES